MDERIIAVLIVCVIILAVVVSSARHCERLTEPDSVPETSGYVRLYEDYRGEKLAFKLDDETASTVPEYNSLRILNEQAGRMIPGQFHRQNLKINLRRADVYLPKVGPPFDTIRKVQIWSVFGGSPSASDMAGFFNNYLEPDSFFRSNPGKFKLLLEVLPGEKVSKEFTEKVNQIFLIAWV